MCASTSGMVHHEDDPDVFRWGLHLLDGYPRSNSESCGSITEYVSGSSPFGYIREGFCVNHVDIIENDAVIAHALQEEFSRVASEEASGILCPDNEEMKESVLSQDWRAPYCMQIPEDSTLDGEVGKRLDMMISVPHVPKVNGSIPSADEEISDHQRLLERLKVYDLVELKVEGDGNCQFRALSDQIYRTPEQYKSVRRQAVNQLRSHSEMYEGYVPMAYKDYLNTMSKNGEWGDHVTLQAVADSYGIKIFVITSYKETCYIEIIPKVQNSKRVIFLSFWAEVHYNSIYPADEMPALEYRRKKKYWLF